MDENPAGVYIVSIFREGAVVGHGVFSTKAKVKEWADKPEFDDAAALIVPFVIDEPDFGNIPKKEMN